MAIFLEAMDTSSHDLSMWPHATKNTYAWKSDPTASFSSAPAQLALLPAQQVFPYHSAATRPVAASATTVVIIASQLEEKLVSNLKMLNISLKKNWPLSFKSGKVIQKKVKEQTQH